MGAETAEVATSCGSGNDVAWAVTLAGARPVGTATVPAGISPVAMTAGRKSAEMGTNRCERRVLTVTLPIRLTM
jgi:hypothetical protein